MSILTNYKKPSIQIRSEPSKPKTSKTRGYMSGHKMTSSQMEAEIIRLSKTHTVAEIEEITGKTQRTIKRYRKKAKESGKILTTESGRITLPQDELAKRQYASLSKDELYEKYQPVKEWVDSKRAEAKGDNEQIKKIKSQLGNLKVVCDTTRLNPHVLLSAGENGKSYGGLERTMKAFSIAMVEQRVVYQNTKQKQPNVEKIDSIIRTYVMACRNFAMYNGVSIPRPMPREHILSGKKVGFGQYAHIKMSWQEIDSCVKLLQKQYGENSIEVAMFVFYYLTGTRNKSIYNAKTTTCKVEKNGWITCRVYESKTKSTWTKYIPDDNPHFEILEKWIESRKKNQKLYLFSETGKYSINFIKELIEKYKKIYQEIGLVEKYFIGHAIHCLRHLTTLYFLGIMSTQFSFHKITLKVMSRLGVF